MRLYTRFNGYKGKAGQVGFLSEYVSGNGNCRRRWRSLSIHPKTQNDTLGHMAGDRLLVSVAKNAQKRTRDIDVVGRWGGEEFFVICPQTGLRGAVELAEQLRLTICETTSSAAYAVTASFGVGEYRQGESAGDIIERVDKALFLAKGGGRNCVRSL
jgi:polar amino acid transport system substrate-binding protein